MCIRDSVKRVLELSQRGLFPGIRGIVADLISVDVRHASLVEAALGDAEQHIVIERRQDLVSSLESLEETLEGRAGFLPLDGLRVAGPAPEGTLGRPGVVGRVSDLVRTAADLRPAVECLLGNTFLVENLATAFELSLIHI